MSQKIRAALVARRMAHLRADVVGAGVVSVATGEASVPVTQAVLVRYDSEVESAVEEPHIVHHDDATHLFPRLQIYTCEPPS